MRMFAALCASVALLLASTASADGPGSAGPDVAAPPLRAAPIRPAQAQPPAAQPAPPQAPVSPPPAAQGRSGVIPLNGGEFSLNVADPYRLYSADDAFDFLQRTRAAPPKGVVLGLLAKNGEDIRAPGVWATVISYDGVGYVAPESASGLAADGFEADVRTARASQSRAFEGFALPPAFRADPGDLIWAERAGAPGSRAADLRYEQRVLGRYGAIGLTSIGSADQMPAISAAAPRLRAMATFAAGRRYGDFQSGADRVSDYTLPALVTGIAPAQLVQEQNAPAPAPARAPATSQTGFGGLAGWFPWIALGVAGLAGAGYLMLRRRPEDDEEAAPPPPSATK